MKKQLIRLADYLDKKGSYKEADYIDNILKSASFRGEAYKEKLRRRKEREALSLSNRMDRYFDELPEGKVLEEMPPRHFFLGIIRGYFSERGIPKEVYAPFLRPKMRELVGDLQIFVDTYRFMKKNMEPFEGLISLDDMRELASYTIPFKVGTHKSQQEKIIILFNEGLLDEKAVEKYLRLVNLSQDHEPTPELLKLIEF